MKRSEINRYIAEADAFFAQNHFNLPPFAHWAPEAWMKAGSEADELREQHLGWDVTDFGSGEFNLKGLTLFTIRNGVPPGSPTQDKVYAEKIMYVRDNQVTPFHYHAIKTEDIINRGGNGAGRLAVQLYNLKEGGGLGDSEVTVSCDGIRRRVPAGGIVYLGSGESITLTPYLYHKFYAVDGDGIIGEVSSVNDDAADNFFLEALPRYPKVVEDDAPLRLLCNEYPAVQL